MTEPSRFPVFSLELVKIQDMFLYIYVCVCVRVYVKVYLYIYIYMVEAAFFHFLFQDFTSGAESQQGLETLEYHE